jgi:hypothetical protein
VGGVVHGRVPGFEDAESGLVFESLTLAKGGRRKFGVHRCSNPGIARPASSSVRLPGAYIPARPQRTLLGGYQAMVNDRLSLPPRRQRALAGC